MKNNQQKLSRCALRQLLQLIAATCYSDDCSVYPTRAIGFGNSNGNDRRVFSLAATVSATVAATVGSGVFRGGAGATAPPPLLGLIVSFWIIFALFCKLLYALNRKIRVPRLLVTVRPVRVFCL